MKKTTTMSLCIICVVLIISVLASVLCSSEHNCSLDFCPVCVLADSFKTALAVLLCAYAVHNFNTHLICECIVRGQNDIHELSNTLTSLKVKLSD